MKAKKKYWLNKIFDQIRTSWNEQNKQIRRSFLISCFDFCLWKCLDGIASYNHDRLLKMCRLPFWFHHSLDITVKGSINVSSDVRGGGHGVGRHVNPLLLMETLLGGTFFAPQEQRNNKCVTLSRWFDRVHKPNPPLGCDAAPPRSIMWNGP